MKKTASIVLAAMLILSIALISVFAEEKQVSSGTFGENLTWSFDEEKKELVISGEGAMPDYNPGGYFVEDTHSQDVSKDVTHVVQTEPSYVDGDPNRPWDEIKHQINTIVIEDGVTHIGDSAFYSCYNLTSVTMGNGVKTVGEHVFSDCYNLTKVKIGKSILTVGDHAFPYYEMDAKNIEVVYYSGSEEQWKSIELGTDNDGLKKCLVIVDCDGSRPKSLAMSFGENLFWTLYTDGELVIDGEGEMEYISDSSSVPWNEYKSQIVKITIGDGVTSIAAGSGFMNCDNLTSVNIGKGVTRIGSIPFWGCSSLESIVVDEGNAAFSSDKNGVLFNKDKTVLLYYPAGNYMQHYTIPDSVISIETEAFRLCENLESVTIGDGVTSIDGRAFYCCQNLKNITFSENISFIGDSAFDGCDSITDIYYMDTQAAWKYVYICDGNDNLLNATVHFSSYEKVMTGNCGKNLTWSLNTATGELVISGEGEMYDYEFNANYGTTDKLAEWCFYDITSVTLFQGVKSIGEYAFFGCESLTSVTIPDGVITIGSCAFESCNSLTNVTIGNSVTTIESGAFAYCTSLTSATIPDSVTTIGDYAFSN